jgi:hypothetical protein
MTRLATNKPPASRTARPANRAIIIHMRDLDDDELPEVDPCAIDCFSQVGTVRPIFSLADMRLTAARKPPGCALSVPVLASRRRFSRAGRVALLLRQKRTNHSRVVGPGNARPGQTLWGRAYPAAGIS